MLDLTGGDTYTFQAGTFNLAGGVETGGGVHATFGTVGTASTYNFGAGTFSCNSSTGYSICNTGTNLTFGGPSPFTMQGGVYNSGGETLMMGAGTTNSFDIGKANDGESFAPRRRRDHDASATRPVPATSSSCRAISTWRPAAAAA